MTGYVRQRDAKIAAGLVVYAEDHKAELDAVQAAFNAAAGHAHSGATGEGPPILVIGPVQDVEASATYLRPKTDNTLDLGDATHEFKDLYIDGVANIDSLVADTADVNGGTIDATVIGATTPAAATVTTLTATSATISGAATINGTTIPATKTLVTTDDTQTLTGKSINLANNTLTTTSAQLAAAVSDETGSGALVFGTAPTISGANLTGVPVAPTAAAATNTTQVATTAHVFAERTNTATLTNKTLTAPAVTSPVITGGTVNGGATLTADSTELNVLDGITATTTQLNTSNSRIEANRDNLIINGDFVVWQRGVSFTTSSVYGADRWLQTFVGGTATQSLQNHTVGDKFGVNTPNYFMRQSVSGQSLAAHYAANTQKIEGVRSYTGQTITVMGWAKRASGSGNVAVDLYQDFGTGGSPSTGVFVAPVTINLTTSWAPFVAVFVVPSIAGKTIGTDFNDSLHVSFFSSAGADYNSRTNSLGIQTIGVDLWGIHIRVGTFTTADVADYISPSFVDEFARCQRYYEVGVGDLRGYSQTGIGHGYHLPFKNRKRVTPALAYSATSVFNVTAWDIRAPTPDGALWYVEVSTNGGYVWRGSWTADAEL